MRFQLDHSEPNSGARAGTLETDHGTIETPMFMPVGTVGSVRAVRPSELLDPIDAQIILGNTYHLCLRPGLDVLQAAGGLHRFMNWKGPLLTDSGGYQVFSLASNARITEEGVHFQSHIDGSYHLFTPESVIDAQRIVGSDIMMVLDECPPADASESYAAASNDLTVRWAKKCRSRWKETSEQYGHSQALFGIVQGVVFPEIRRQSARSLIELDFPGYAIGGLSVGESAELMYAMVEVVTELLPEEKPRYLMGVGTPTNLIENIARGIDLFDCVMPTRNGRNGMLFTTEGVINIKNHKWQHDFTPLDPGLKGNTSNAFSKSYVRHLFMANEILGLQIASVQNLSFYIWLMREARNAILENRFGSWSAEVLRRIDHRL